MTYTDPISFLLCHNKVGLINWPILYFSPLDTQFRIRYTLWPNHSTFSCEGPLEEEYSIKIHKQYFNFAASHFLIFSDGTREPLHGHNYRVLVKVHGHSLQSDMVFDFLDIKPLVREVCDSLDHTLLLPQENPLLKIELHEKMYRILTPCGDYFMIPQKDVTLLPLPNTSAERLAIYISQQIRKLLLERFQFKFKILEVEVEETPGQSATYQLSGE